MSTYSIQGRPALALVPPLPAAVPVAFCGHCGVRPEPDAAASPTRVCSSCGLGLLLECDADVAPNAGDAYMVLDHALSVCAMSDAAERLLATPEIDAIHRPITQLVVPADTEASAEADLAAAIMWSARGDERVTHTVVRPASTFGVRLKARIAGCGPPRAALLVFE
jgi:hypothetical protein